MTSYRAQLPYASPTPSQWVAYESYQKSVRKHQSDLFMMFVAQDGASTPQQNRVNWKLELIQVERHYMTNKNYHLAQLNIASMLGAIDSDIMAGFVARLDEINTLADSYDGFVWRLQTEDGDATALRPYEDDRIIVNMSVWESVDALFDYTYKSTHLELLKSRWDWFAHMKDFHMCMWWMPAGTIPTTDDAKHRLDYMIANGITPYAFTFKQRYTVDEMLAYSAAK